MENLKPTLSIIVHGRQTYTEEELCAGVASAVIWYVDENYSDENLGNGIFVTEWWQAGALMDIRVANEEQWKYFITSPGMTGQYGNVEFHVVPPIPASNISEQVQQCSEDFTPIIKKNAIDLLNEDISFPVLSINIKRDETSTLKNYIIHSISASLFTYLSNRNEDKNQHWSDSDFSILVSLVDRFDNVTEPEMVITIEDSEESGIEVFWIEDMEILASDDFTN